MKKPALIKQLFFASIAIAGMNLFSSCDGCSRKTTETTTVTTETTDTTSTTSDDTGYINDDNSGNTSGVNDGTTSSASIRTSTPAGSKTTTGTSTAATGTKKSGLSEEEITNQIENSDARSGAVDKKGNPIKSSGDAGSGMGTGTGSTGNNSRVTTREAQKGN